MPVPLQTASGHISHAPLVLVALKTNVAWKVTLIFLQLNKVFFLQLTKRFMQFLQKLKTVPVIQSISQIKLYLVLNYVVEQVSLRWLWLQPILQLGTLQGFP